MFRFRSLALFVMLAVAPLAAQAGTAEVKQFIDQLGQQVLGIAKQQGRSEQEKEAELKNLFFQNVDVDWIGKFVVSRAYRSATPEQQQKYMENYRNFIATNYTSKLREYTGETYKITNVREEGNGKYHVAMQIVRPGGQNVQTDYMVKEAEGGYKIFDIIVEGVSLITTQRSEFSSVISRQGMDYLIQQLAYKAEHPQPNANPNQP